MDSTGLLGYIQASQKTAMILSDRGYVVKERGIINVKGKGEMRTYFVLGRRISRAWRTGRGSGTTNNSLAEVVYGMVRARRRRTLKRKEDNEETEQDSLPVQQEGNGLRARNNPIRKSLRRLNTLRGGSGGREATAGGASSGGRGASAAGTVRGGRGASTSGASSGGRGASAGGGPSGEAAQDTKIKIENQESNTNSSSNL